MSTTTAPHTVNSAVTSTDSNVASKTLQPTPVANKSEPLKTQERTTTEFTGDNSNSDSYSNPFGNFRSIDTYFTSKTSSKHKQHIHDEVYGTPENVLDIEVCEPITHGTSSGGILKDFFSGEKYTDYKIVTVTNNPLFGKAGRREARRRFKDFVLFRELLKDKAPNVKIPPLPERVWGLQRFESEVLEERAKELQAFLRQVIGHPLLQYECIQLLREFINGY